MSPIALLVAASLMATRFGPADIVDVQPMNPGVRIVAYGDTHLVRIEATDAELAACRETIRQGAGPRTCTFARGGTIAFTPLQVGTLVMLTDGERGNIVDFVLNGAELTKALVALSP